VAITSGDALRATLMRVFIPGHQVSPPVALQQRESHVVGEAVESGTEVGVCLES
jgi:hypothetical protein